MSSDALGLENLVKEFMRDERVPVPWYVVAPNSTAKLCWDGVVLLFILVSAVSIPAQLAFSSLMASEFSEALSAFHTALLVVYGLDLCLWFFVSFQQETGAWAVTLDQIVRNYARTWLAVDLLAVVPWAVAPWAARGLPSVPALAMSKVLRLSRVLTPQVGPRARPRPRPHPRARSAAHV